MELYLTKSSPYAQCVRMVISEIGIEEQVEVIEAHPFDNDENFLEINPLGKVPCLVDAGEVILDSEVICDYLDASYTGGTLFNTIYADWRLKSFYSICSGLIDVCVAKRIEDIRSQEGSGSDFWMKRNKDAIKRTLAVIENKLSLLPEEYCILHINLLCGLNYLNFRHKDILWQEKHPALAEFYRAFSNRESCINNALAD